MKKSILLIAIFAVVVGGCKKSSSSPSSNPTSVTTNSTPQLSLTVNGTKSSYVSGTSIVTYVGSGGSPSQTEYDSGLNYNNLNNDEIFNISKGVCVFPFYPCDSTIFNNFFTVGTYPFVISTDTSAGVNLEYFINGVKWATYLGSGLQVGSTFKIVSTRKVVTFSTVDVFVVVNFNCIIYDGTGQSKTITNGVYVGPFENV